MQIKTTGEAGMRSLSRNGVGGLCCPLPSEQQDGISHPRVRICPVSAVEGGQHQAVPLQRCWGPSCSILPGLAGSLLCPGFPENLSWIPPSADPARWGCSGIAIGLAGRVHPCPQRFPSLGHSSCRCIFSEANPTAWELACTQLSAHATATP